MRAAVCDDNIIFLEEMKREIGNLGDIKDIFTYSEIDVFFDDISKGKTFDVIFLDIDWGEVKTTGLEFGEKLYQAIPHVPVVLMTGYNDRFAQQILLKEMNLAGYLTKPINMELVTKYLEKIRNTKSKVKYINLNSQGVHIRLETGKIIHIESHNHQIHVYTENEKYVLYEKISDIQKRLPKEFVQCHKSFLVNLEQVSSLEGKEVVMKNGKHIAISRSFYKKMREEFFEHIGNMI